MKLFWPVVGEMTLLSRIIKSHVTDTSKDANKIIHIKKIINEPNEESTTKEEELHSIDFALIQANEKAESILKEAREKAEQIHIKIQEEIQRWNDEKQSLVEEARREGYQVGREQGVVDSQKECQHLLDLAKETVTHAKYEYQSVVEKSEMTILNLGIKVAEKIMNQQLDQNNENYLFIVKNAIKEAREYKNIELHVHPVHYSFILSHKKELMALFPRETEFYIYPNDELVENGCVIESSNGRLVASVDEQLEQIRIKLLEILEEGHS